MWPEPRLLRGGARAPGPPSAAHLPIRDLWLSGAAVPRRSAALDPRSPPAAAVPRSAEAVAARRRAAGGSRAIAVALHGVEPATYERCALIRDWLDDHGVDKVTLLVIPASDLHPFSDRRPEMVDWLIDRVDGGDTVAQHGFQHRQARRGAGVTRPAHGGRPGTAEFVGLDEGETRRAVESGRRLLRLAGLQPRGFVAPAYAYTAALQRVLATSFDWWAGLRGLSLAGGRPVVRSQALRLGTTTPLQRLASPVAVRAGACLAGPLLRLDLHPADLDHPGHMSAVECVLRRARDRTARTYDELALQPAPA